MANILSAKKRARQTVKKTMVNTARRSMIKTAIRKVEEAITAKNKPIALAAFKLAEPQIMRGVTKGVLKPHTASRRVSGLSSRVKALS